jgi:beta-glucanase (GH16 family)
MKKISHSSIFIAFFCVAAMYGCKKNATVTPDDNKTDVIKVNPKTATTVCDYDFDDKTLTGAGWTKAFDDEFTGDLSNWYAYTGSVKNELQWYKPANAVVSNGVLQLIVKKESVTGSSADAPGTQATYNFTSGSVVSNAQFAASSTTPKVRIVARMKVASGYGLTSLFESYGINWPTNGQINFVQVSGNSTKQYATDYFYGTQANQNLVTNAFYFNPADNDLSTCWHVYVTEWTQNALNFYLDGQLVETKTGTYIPSLYGKMQNIALNVPLGGLFYENLVPANIQTGTMYVDYVKVFTSN